MLQLHDHQRVNVRSRMTISIIPSCEAICDVIQATYTGTVRYSLSSSSTHSSG